MKARAIYFGSSDIGLPALEALFDADGIDLVGIVSQPDRPSGRGQKSSMNAVVRWANERQMPCLQPDRMDGQAYQWLQAKKPDLAIVMAYGHILKQHFLDLPTFGMWNLHASLLPLYRGASPLQFTLLDGQRETGVTLMKMVEKMDAGPWIAQETVGVGPKETAVTLKQQLAKASAVLLQKNLSRLLQKNVSLQEQDEQKASYTRKLRKEDGALNFFDSAEYLERKIRAFDPWPGTFFYFGKHRIKVGAAEVVAGNFFSKPGTVVESDKNCLLIATEKNLLSVKTLQKEGGIFLPVEVFLRGFEIPKGSILQRP